MYLKAKMLLLALNSFWCVASYDNQTYLCILGQLEGMGFNRELVLEVFFACNKDEELAANYLLDHGHEFDEQQQ
jgi:hypothetical protein